MKTLPTMPIQAEKHAVESRLAEIENEMSTAHRDHAFEHWWHQNDMSEYEGKSKPFAKKAFDRAHSIYCREPRLVIQKPSAAASFALYAIGVVSGIIIAIVTFLLTVNPN